LRTYRGWPDAPVQRNLRALVGRNSISLTTQGTAYGPIRTLDGSGSNVRKGSTAAHHRPPLRTASLFVSGRRCVAADPRPQQTFRSSAFPDDVASSALLATTSRLGSRGTRSYGGIRPRSWRPLPALTRGHPLLVSALLPNAERGIAEEIATSGTSAGECVNARPRLGQNARCADCGKRGAQVMRDMKAHYAEVEANGGFSVRFPAVEG
jgi:hypothetical protein